MDTRRQNCQSSYDAVADEYAQRIFQELRHKPFDRQLLDRFAAEVKDVGPACDLGCGPGQVAQYLHERGVQVIGIDLSPAMVERAKQLVPGVEFRQGDMTALDLPDESFAGIAAFYSIIHIPREDLAATLTELHRVLRPGGLLLLVFHIGDSTIHLDEWWGPQSLGRFSLPPHRRNRHPPPYRRLHHRRDHRARSLPRSRIPKPAGVCFARKQLSQTP